MKNQIKLFEDKKVQILSTEFYLKGLRASKIKPEQVIVLLTVDFKMLCFDHRFESGVEKEHPEDMNDYMILINNIDKKLQDENDFWGFFEDFACVSPAYSN